ncbi:MAG: hypothetical protein JXQ90_18215 [Cyclobacteriaceae bacterium]
MATLGVLLEYMEENVKDIDVRVLVKLINQSTDTRWSDLGVVLNDIMVMNGEVILAFENNDVEVCTQEAVGKLRIFESQGIDISSEVVLQLGNVKPFICPFTSAALYQDFFLFKVQYKESWFGEAIYEAFGFETI